MVKVVLYETKLDKQIRAMFGDELYSHINNYSVKRNAQGETAVTVEFVYIDLDDYGKEESE